MLLLLIEIIWLVWINDGVRSVFVNCVVYFCLLVVWFKVNNCFLVLFIMIWLLVVLIFEFKLVLDIFFCYSFCLFWYVVIIFLGLSVKIILLFVFRCKCKGLVVEVEDIFWENIGVRVFVWVSFGSGFGLIFFIFLLFV